MSQNFFFFTTLSSLCLVSAFMVVLTKNPMNSALFLIVCFCNISCILFLLELEYLPLVFLIVYVGAIAVLLLFVIMLLNIRVSLLKETGSQFFFIAIILAINFIVQLFFIFQAEFTSLVFFKTSNALESTTFLSEIFCPITEIQTENTVKNLGFVVYSQFYYPFLVSSLILLLAMIGAIVLTLQKSFKGKKQSIPHQVLSNFEINLLSSS
jgi:NADH:ubiquinone oxidoreductase subunit 6 (subunit J)